MLTCIVTILVLRYLYLRKFSTSGNLQATIIPWELVPKQFRYNSHNGAGASNIDQYILPDHDYSGDPFDSGNQFVSGDPFNSGEPFAPGGKHGASIGLRLRAKAHLLLHKWFMQVAAVERQILNILERIPC